MMKDNILKLKNAYADYNLNNTYKITEDLLKYILERINANKKEIEDLIKIRKEQVTFEEICSVVKAEIEDEVKYKNYKKMQINKIGFLSTSILMPIGIIAVEAFETKEVLKYILRAIKSRNALAISDVEYDERCVKFLLLEIIKEALIKFKINPDLIMILPYEECFYENFDKVIYTYDEDGKTLEKNKYNARKKSDDLFVYIQDGSLYDNAIKDNKDAKIVDGEFDEVINQINEKKSLGAVIYTTDSNLAYKFINLVHSQNVLVNASLENAEKTPDSIQEMYEYKNIIIPIPKEEKKEIEDSKLKETKKENKKLEETKEEKVKETEIKKTKQKESEIETKNTELQINSFDYIDDNNIELDENQDLAEESEMINSIRDGISEGFKQNKEQNDTTNNEKQEMSLTKVNDGIFARIKNFLKRLFK